MICDPFGDLREWGRVLAQLQCMRADGTLGHCQRGLARLVRYPFNGRLREAGLKAIAELDAPSDVVLQAASRVLRDEEAAMETRLLAGAAVSHALTAAGSVTGAAARAEAAEAIRLVLVTPQHPALHTAVHKWRQALLRQGTQMTIPEEGGPYYANEHDDLSGKRTQADRSRDGKARRPVAQPLRPGPAM